MSQERQDTSQRLLLEVHAWILYVDVVQPRLEDPTFHAKNKVLPLRGVITGRHAVAEEMFRVGVPVWLVRPIHSFTSHTVICKTVTPLDWIDFFSFKSKMVHGKFSMETPRWIDGVAVDTIGEGLARQLWRYGLSARPHLCRSQPVWKFDDFDEENEEDVRKRQRSETIRPLFNRFSRKEDDWRVSKQKETLMRK